MKPLKILEKYFLIIIATLMVLFWVICYFFFKDFFQQLVNWIVTITYTEDNNLITVSTVFIGIYFTLYTYLLSVTSDSILAKLELREFKKLARMITIGFLSSLIIVLCSFIKSDAIWYFFLITGLSFFLFASTIEISIYYTLIFRRDLDEKFNQLKNQELESRKDQQLKKDMKDFLERNK
ncbi:hypothetical protein [Streptococcus pluranimalium]|uniref:hypothetical protein n=1 Tax=Streptococcus pluranimalium TaxID=82348 RepID=UPI003F678A4B